MNKLDKAVIELNGVLPDYHSEKYAMAKNALYMPFVLDSFICTGEQFIQRAKEMGFVNGYRWGVEYPTNGKRPDLSDDVLVSVGGLAAISYIHVANVEWSITNRFKLVGNIEKPVDTSYLDKPESSLDNGADWYDYDSQKALRLPPAGTECEYEDSPEVKGYSKCTILAVLTDAFAFSRPDYKNTIFTGNFRTHTLRPLDYDRKQQAKRKAFVDAAVKCLSEFKSANQVFGELFDAGFKAPEQE